MGKLSIKNKALNSIEEKFQIAKENVALVVAKKDKQSSDLMSFQKVNEDIKAQLHNFDRRLKDAELRCVASDSKVVYYEFADYTAKVVDIYQSSLAYKDELYSKCNGFYERG